MSAELRRLGIEAVRQQNYVDAVRWLAKYVVTAPDDDAEARLALALAYAGTGDPGKSLSIIDRLIAQQPPSANLQYQRGSMLERLDRKREAIEAYRQALVINPSHEKALKRRTALDVTPPVKAVVDAVLIDDGVEDAILIEPRRQRRHDADSSGNLIYIVLGSTLGIVMIVGLIIYLAMPKGIGVPGGDFIPGQAQVPPGMNPGRKVVPPDFNRLDDAAVDEAISTLNGKEAIWHPHALMRLRHLKPNARQNEVIALVAPLLDGNNISTRVMALDVLATWGTRDCIPAIRKLESDTNMMIKRKAAETIAAIERRA